MKKTSILSLLPFAFCLLVSNRPALALDVIYFDPVTKKEVKVRKVVTPIEEKPEGITFKAAGKTYKVSALNVRELDLDAPDVQSPDYATEFRKPFRLYDQANLATKPADRIKLWEESIPNFVELIAKRPQGPGLTNMQRYVEFKHAQVLGKLAQSSKEELVKKYRDQAIAALSKFSQEHAAGWQISPALMMLAQLQEDTGDLAAVQKTYEALSTVPGLSEEIRTTSSINSARTLMKLEKFDDAKTKLSALKQQLGDSPLAAKVQVYLAQCQIMGTDDKEAAQAEKQLREMLAASDDKSFKALAHNTLGDYYTKLKRDEDAFWEYLRVDTLYSEDRFEHARAMYNLIRLFRDVKKDSDRSDQYLDTLTKDARFANLEYQKKAMKK